MGKLDDFIRESRAAGYKPEEIAAFVAASPELSAEVSQPAATPSPATATSPAPAAEESIQGRLAREKSKARAEGRPVGDDIKFKDPSMFDRYVTANVAPVAGAVGGVVELAAGVGNAAFQGAKEMVTGGVPKEKGLSDLVTGEQSAPPPAGIPLPGVPGLLTPEVMKKGFTGFVEGANAVRDFGIKATEVISQSLGVDPGAILDVETSLGYDVGTVVLDPTALVSKPAKAGKAAAGVVAETVQKFERAGVQLMGDQISAIKAGEKVKLTAGQVREMEQFAPVKRVTEALEKAKPIREAQEKLYTKERGKRISKAKAAWEDVGGKEGFQAAKSEMSGELPKADFESILGDLKEGDVNALFERVRSSEKIGEFEKLSAADGLARLFGEAGGQVPQRAQLAKLEKVFGKRFVEAAKDNRSLWSKVKEGALEYLNVPRAIMASVDLSAPMRQGLFFIGRRQFYSEFDDMFKAFGSEKAADAIDDAIRQLPQFEKMQEYGIAFTDRHALLEMAEEAYAGAQLAEKIPVLGRPIAASNRAYTAYLNKLRADVANELFTKAESLGLDLAQSYKPKAHGAITPEPLGKEIAEFINAATGRGDFRHVVGDSVGGAIHKANNLLNAVFFSPKLMASRLTLLNPGYYLTRSPFVRKEALKDLAKVATFGTTVLGLTAAAGAKIERDPRSSDFGKVRVGNTRVDPWGGFQQYIRMFAQLATGEYISATDRSGLVKALGEEYGKPTRLDILYRQIESKEAPVMSLATTLLRGRDYRGKPVSLPKEVASRFVPMMIQDAFELYEADPSHLPLMGAAMFGVGVQNFSKGNDLESLTKEYKQLSRAESYVKKKGDPKTRERDIARIKAAQTQVRLEMDQARKANRMKPDERNVLEKVRDKIAP